MKLIPKYQSANQGRIGMHQERGINGEYIWVPNNKVGIEHSTGYIAPTQGTIKSSTISKQDARNALLHTVRRLILLKVAQLLLKAKTGDLKAVAELQQYTPQAEVNEIEPFSDETTLASERALYYWDPIKGIVQRWNTSWDNDTNPVKGVLKSPIVYANPLTAAGASVYHLASDNGVKKTYNLAKQGEYGQAAISGLGDILDASMIGYLPKGLNGMARSINGEIQSTSFPMFNFTKSDQLLSLGKNIFLLKGSPWSIALENITNPTGLKIAKDVTKNNPFSFSNYKFLGDSRFTTDLRIYPYSTLEERVNGNYPLTFGERRNWITNVKDDINKGINFVKEEAEMNPNITGLSSSDEVEYAKKLNYLLDDKNVYGEKWNTLWDIYRKLIPDAEHQYNFQRLLESGNSAEFGTRTSINHYGRGRDVYPDQASYGAFALRGKTYYPFRTSSGTLSTNSMLHDSGSRTLVGAHEYEHTVLGMHKTPLVVYDPKVKGEYGRYTNYDLNLNLWESAENIIGTADTYGKWEGSLGEMDSELKGWRAENDLPKYTKLAPAWLFYIVNKANNRFGLMSKLPFTMKDINSGKITNNLIKDVLENLKFHRLFTNLELSGYNQGGKLIKRDKR